MGAGWPPPVHGRRTHFHGRCFPARTAMEPDEPIEHELPRRAVAVEVTVTNTEVQPSSTGDGYIPIERAWATTGAPSRSRRRRALPPPPTQPIRTPPKAWNPSRLDRCPGTRLTPISNTHA